MMSRLIVLLLAAVGAAVAVEYKRVCYASNWSQYRPEPAIWKMVNINPTHCTHVIFAFAKLDGNRLSPYEWNDDSTEYSVGQYEELNKHKAANAALKTLLAVGGWNLGTQPFTAMMSTDASRKEFIDTSIPFLRSRNFDGLDLDFEYPASRDSPPEDKGRFTTLVSELRAAFDAEALSSGKARLLLTAAVGAGKTTVDNGYEIPQLSTHLDWFNLMTYDMNGAWDTVTGFNAPLYSRQAEVGTSKETFNVDWAARYWVSKGAPKEKIVLGTATYGRCFQLTNAQQNGVGAAAKGPCTAGAYTREAGFLSYYEICKKLAEPGTVRVFSDEQKVPYAYNGDQWIGYDDAISLQAKIEYIKVNGYGGWMTWNYDLDDFKGDFCGSGPYPLLTKLNQFLLGSTSNQSSTPAQTAHPSSSSSNVAASTSTTTTKKTTTKATTTTTTTAAATATTGPFCQGKADGLYVNPASCTSFYNCANGNGGLTQCSSGLYFDEVNLVCNWATSLTPARRSQCGV